MLVTMSVAPIAQSGDQPAEHDNAARRPATGCPSDSPARRARATASEAAKNNPTSEAGRSSSMIITR